MERFGEKLRALRIRKGLTLKQLALELGLSSHGYISELECGKKKPTVDIVVAIAELFNITTDELIKDDIEINYIKLSKSKK